MNDQIILYDFHGSPCARRVRIVLLEKGLQWETRLVDLTRVEQKKPEYLKLNPNGLVPTLVHGDHVIYESNVITEYLDAMFPEPRLNKRHENSDKLFLDTLRCLVNTPSLKFKDLTKPEDDTAVA